MFHDPRSGKRRSRRHDAATLPARVPIAHILIFSSPSNRDRLRVVSPHWNNSEKASRQHYYHPLVVDKCPVTKTTFNPKIDYRKRFIGLAKIVGPEQTAPPACVEKEFDVQAANSALQQFNERYSFLVVGKQWKRVHSQDNNAFSHRVELGETLFKQPATISFLTGAGTQSSPKTQGEITMNVKLEPIVLPKNDGFCHTQVMLTFWIIDKKTDAIGKWGDYDSLLESWISFNFEDGTPDYDALDQWGGPRMEVGSAWTGGHSTLFDAYPTSSFSWFDALPTHRYYKDFDEIDVNMRVSRCKYKLITPPALEFPGEDELGDEEFDAAVEQWEEDNPDTLTAFELSFEVLATDFNDYSCSSTQIPFTIDDLCKSVNTVPWI